MKTQLPILILKLQDSGIQQKTKRQHLKSLLVQIQNIGGFAQKAQIMNGKYNHMSERELVALSAGATPLFFQVRLQECVPNYLAK